MREITKLENAIFSIVLVAVILFSITLQYYVVTAAAIWMIAYIKWCVVKYTDFATKLDKINLYAYTIVGFMYSVLCVLMFLD
tara:strand:+ start:1578 stop:1823 length:246 start_codon:yes stop_codon:yes gene_type:complete